MMHRSTCAVHCAIRIMCSYCNDLENTKDHIEDIEKLNFTSLVLH